MGAVGLQLRASVRAAELGALAEVRLRMDRRPLVKASAPAALGGPLVQESTADRTRWDDVRATARARGALKK